MNSICEDPVVIDLIADTQGEIYQMADKMGFRLEDFSNAYLNSSFCTGEMDAVYSKYQTELADACMECVLAEFQDKNIQLGYAHNDYYAGWIGRMYRYLHYATGLNGPELQEKIPFTFLADKSIELEECEYEESVQIILDEITVC